MQWGLVRSCVDPEWEEHDGKGVSWLLGGKWKIRKLCGSSYLNFLFPCSHHSFLLNFCLFTFLWNSGIMPLILNLLYARFEKLKCFFNVTWVKHTWDASHEFSSCILEEADQSCILVWCWVVRPTSCYFMLLFIIILVSPKFILKNNC